jgi:putative aldouronate transport system permease protein
VNGSLEVTLGRARKYRTLYLIMIPGLAWFFVYRYLPMFGIVIAFKDYSVFKGVIDSPWVSPWYRHFVQFFRSPYFVQLLSNTLIISFGKILFSVVPSIFLAIVLSECRFLRFKKVVQTLSYMPHFLSWVIVYALVYALLSQNGGFLNQIIQNMRGEPIDFLANPAYFRWLLLFSESWQSAGWGAIIYLAAITSIDPELYDAAYIDGASRIQRIIYITIPGMASVIIYVLILRIGRVLNAGFEHVFVFYNPRVYEVGDIFDTWVFRVGLEQRNYGLASAVGLFKSIIGFVLVILTNRVARAHGRGLW